MSTATQAGVSALSPFKHEPYADFTKADNKSAMEAALAAVRAELGKDYPLWIDGQKVTTMMKKSRPGSGRIQPLLTRRQ